MTRESSRLSLAGVASALPRSVVENDFFPPTASKSAMFMGSQRRRHVHAETSSDLIVEAARTLEARLGIDLAGEVDTVLTNAALPDEFFTGTGAVVAKRLGMRAPHVIDMHNGGCVSFITLAELARDLIVAGRAKTILLGIAQTAAGRLFAREGVRELPQSRIPGDGAAVALLTAEGDCPISHITVRCHPEFAEDMSVIRDTPERFWEPSNNPLYIAFPDAKSAQIVARGNRLVPEVMHELLAAANLKSTDIDALITNQPNPIFLRNWREAIELPAERHLDTFTEYANLFQAGIPITLDHAIRDGRIGEGATVLLAGFSHAGDYSAAALLRWKV